VAKLVTKVTNLLTDLLTTVNSVGTFAKLTSVNGLSTVYQRVINGIPACAGIAYVKVGPADNPHPSPFVQGGRWISGRATAEKRPDFDLRASDRTRGAGPCPPRADRGDSPTSSNKPL